MTPAEGKLQSLLAQIEAREQAARRRALLYTLIPILVAAGLIAFSLWQINQAGRQLATVNGSLGNTNAQLSTAQAELTHTQKELSAAQGDLKTAQQQLVDMQAQLKTAQKQIGAAQEQLKEAQQQVKTLTASVQAYQAQTAQQVTQIDDLNATIANLQANPAAASVQQNRYLGQPTSAVPSLVGAYPRQAQLLEDLLASQGKVAWKPGGASLKEGFDSPSFAAYLLVQRDLISTPLTEARYILPQLLERAARPQPGDLVFYKPGYVMFYFLDPSGKPFVIGMTPDGVLALQLNFAEIDSYGRIQY